MTFDWKNPYPTVRAPVFARNVVATSQPLAAQAGLQILQRGGNAVDAAIADSRRADDHRAVQQRSRFRQLRHPLGSGTQQLHGLNSSGIAPAAWTLDYFRRKYGDEPGQRPSRGWDSVTVPGAVAGWSLLHRRFGKLPFGDVLAPGAALRRARLSRCRRSCRRSGRSRLRS